VEWYLNGGQNTIASVESSTCQSKDLAGDLPPGVAESEKNKDEVFHVGMVPYIK
jgi:hypothetical protein